jgi:hypothetical protein
MTRGSSKAQDVGRGPGMTPIDNPAPDLSDDDTPEPDRTTGRLPAQEDDSALKTTTPKKRKSASAGSRNR